MHHSGSQRKPRRHLIGPTLVPWKARGGSRLRPVPRGQYGVVRIARGRSAGRLAYYDDDEVLGNSIVYPWGTAPAGYVVVRHTSLAEATPGEQKLWATVNENRFSQRTVKEWFRKHRATLE